MFAESVLKADSDGRANSAAISKAAIAELHQYNSGKEEAKEAISKINNFLNEFANVNKRLALVIG